MKKVCISKNWLFCSPDFNGTSTVDLPHDYSIKLPRDKNAPDHGSNGFFTGTSGEYTKYMTFDDSAHTILDIDGAYMCARISFNDNQTDMHPNGYMPYLVDISDRVHPGRNNKISIHVTNVQPSTRWYSGSGVYRDVFIWTGGKIRIEPWDLYVTTESISEKSARVAVRTCISADYGANIKLEFDFADKNGNTVLSKTRNVDVISGKNDFVFDFDIENPLLWDCDNPNLYTLGVKIYSSDVCEDEFTSRFGIRTVQTDAENGLRLNGKSVKLHGGCIHHDHALLGSAEYPAAVRRKLEKLKSVGFDSVRTAHCPPSLTFLELCDEMGIIVMDEAFDVWNKPKKIMDYSLWFADWWDRDISYMVKRDRSHPCVFSYSTGNEIIECNGSSDGYVWAKKLADEIRKYDTTRPVTSAVCCIRDEPNPYAPDDYKQDYKKLVMLDYPDTNSSWDKRTEKYMDPLDIVGYNYMFERYAKDREKYKDRVIWGSETHALYFYDSWKAVTENPNVIGDFTWTAYDNLGEAGTGRFGWGGDGVYIRGISIADYPWRACYQGDFDLCGNRRPQSYFREAIWKDMTAPHIFTTHPKRNGDCFSGTVWHWYDVHETWTFDEEYIGQPVKTDVYTTADEVVFYLGEKEVARAVPEKAIATAYIPYQPVKLTAAAFRNGKEECRFSLCPVNKAHGLTITPDKDSIRADNRDLCYFDISVTDRDGNPVTDGEHEISVTVYGAELIGVYGANPCNEDMYGTDKCHTFEGKALAVVKAASPDYVRVFVSSCGLNGAVAFIPAIQP